MAAIMAVCAVWGAPVVTASTMKTSTSSGRMMKVGLIAAIGQLWARAVPSMTSPSEIIGRVKRPR
ncbi:hypothetical protein D3C86_2263170 [compost metagenome]